MNLILDHAEQIHDGVEAPPGERPRVQDDVEALRRVFRTGERAAWQLAVSPYTYREVIATQTPARRRALQSWFFEVWGYWREFLHSSPALPSFAEAEEIRLTHLASGMLDLLPDLADRVLICDALVYRCDLFCTRDWTTILRYREQLKDIPLRIVTPAEWWGLIEPWGALWE